MYNVRPIIAKIVPLIRQFDIFVGAKGKGQGPADADCSNGCGEIPEVGEDYQRERGALVEARGGEDAPVEEEDGELAGVLGGYYDEEGD